MKTLVRREIWVRGRESRILPLVLLASITSLTASTRQRPSASTPQGLNAPTPSAGLKTLSDPSGGFILRFRDFALTNPSGPVTHLDLQTPGGQVYLASKRQGIELWAPKLSLDATSTNGKDMNSVRNAVASGGIRAVRTAANGRSEIMGATAKYVVKGNSASLAAAGPIKMIASQGGAQSFTATGSSLEASLGNVTSKEALETATLLGPVTLRIRKAAQGTAKASDMGISAGRMVYNAASKPATIKLISHVRISGLFSGTTFEGTAGQVTLTLSDRGEVTSASGVGG